MDQIEEIKSKIDIVDLVKEYLQLSVAGVNFKARCPFHAEKTPSFMVSPGRQTFHCFGCGVGGDVFTFFQKQEGVEFGEALRVLAQRAGVALERVDPRVQDEKNRLLSLIDLASQYYHQALLRSPQAQTARTYLLSRGIDASTIDEWRIGYALSDYEALSNFLISRKFTANELLQVGLSLKKDRGYGLFDRFRNRIMIPIRNVHGAVIGFGGRILDAADVGAKYINSPQTILYDKGRTVFGLDRAKTEIRRADRAILVEGYMDCFAVAGSGMRNVVAASGTALTVDQIRLIKRFTQHFHFSFDTDSAGAQATMRGIELALKEGVDARVIRFVKNADGTPRFKDPDECVKKDPAAWGTAVDQAVSFVEYCFSQAITDRSKTDSFEKKIATRRLLDVIRLIPDRIEQDHWIKRLATELGLSEPILWEELAKGRHKENQTTPAAFETKETKATTPADTLLALLAHMPDMIEKAGGVLDPDMLDNPANAELYRTIQGLYASWKVKEEGDFLVLLETAIPKAVLQMYSFLIERDFFDVDHERRGATAYALAKNLATSAVKKKIKGLEERMRQAERESNANALAECATEFSTLQTKLFTLNS